MSLGLAVTNEGSLGLKKELVLSREIILKRVQELAQQISTDYDGREPILVGILNGVVFFFADLVRRLNIPSKIDFVRAASYGSGVSLLIPSGQSVTTSTVLVNQALSASTTYTIEFVLIFEDETYETYSTSYTTSER